MDPSEAEVLRQVAAGYRSSAARETDEHRISLLAEIAAQLEADAARLETQETSGAGENAAASTGSAEA